MDLGVPKRYIEILTASNSECDPIWKQGPSRDNQVKTNPPG